MVRSSFGCLAALVVLALTANRAAAQPINYATFLNTPPAIPGVPGTPIDPARIVNPITNRAHIFFLGNEADNPVPPPPTIPDADGTILFTVFGGGKNFNPASPDSGLIRSPDAVVFQGITFDARAALTNFNPADDLGAAPGFQQGDFVYVAIYINDDGQLGPTNGCLSMTSFTFGLDPCTFVPNGIPATGSAGLFVTCAGDNDVATGVNIGSAPAQGIPSLSFNSAIGILGFFIGNLPTNLVSPPAPCVFGTPHFSKPMFYSSPFGPCFTRTAMLAGQGQTVNVAAMEPCTFPKFVCNQLVSNPPQVTPGQVGVTITATIQNPGTLVGNVKARLVETTPGGPFLTVTSAHPVEITVARGASSPANFTVNVAPGAVGPITARVDLELDPPYNQEPFGQVFTNPPCDFRILSTNVCPVSIPVVCTPSVRCDIFTASTGIIVPNGSVTFTLTLRNTRACAGSVNIAVNTNCAGVFQGGSPLFTENNVTVPANQTVTRTFQRNFTATPPCPVNCNANVVLTGLEGTQIEPTVCQVNFQCGTPQIPTLSEWGLIALTAGLLVSILLARRRIA